MFKLSKTAITIVSIVVVTTIILFFLFRPAEPSVVYWFNLLVFIAIEVMAGTLISGGRGNWSMPFYVTLWSIFSAYTVLSVCTMALYFALVEPGIIRLATEVTIPTSYLDWVGDNILQKISDVFQENQSLGRNIYFSCFLLLTAIAAITIVVINNLDKKHTAETAELEERHVQIINIASEMDMLRKRYERICQKQGIAYDTQSNNRTAMDPLCSKVQYLTPNVVRHEQAQQFFSEALAAISAKLAELDTATADEAKALDNALRTHFANMADEVDRLKTICRR